MKKRLLFIVSLITMISFPSSALACYCTQGMLQQGNQCVAPIGPNNSYVVVGYAVCGSSAPQTVHVYVYDYLNLLWTKNHEPYFFKTYYKSPYQNFNYDMADQDALNACNAHDDLRPCKHSTSALGDACIAYLDTPEIAYGQVGNTCNEAKAILKERCMKKYKKKGDAICHNIQTKQPFEVN
ncbi:hypothetical protein [Mannheimia granulomatis]|uniref:hypothetical protein n=1 Tax=Mannheimia granulomatis TaxID=85402 RepID=UPI00047D31DB|nr:hypothetical protein [Mannheimia granulomatis]QLB19818.1 hypothetical protein A6B41_10355 [Mannheimia granulomatis]